MTNLKKFSRNYERRVISFRNHLKRLKMAANYRVLCNYLTKNVRLIVFFWILKNKNELQLDRLKQ